jgi:DNA primase
MSQSKFVDFRAVKREITMLQVLEHYGLMGRMHRNGDSITGACPIHEGKNETAFRVSISKNCWNCFSRCQCGGNVLDFVAKNEKVSLLRAANLLIEWFSLRIESRENGHHHARREEPHSLVREQSKLKPEETKPAADDSNGENKPLEFVLKNLQAEHPYLTERGLTAETIQTFGLGFCSKGLQKDRIAISIHNETGQLVAYAGRWPGSIDKEKYQLPKGFKKSLELFNLHRAIAEPADKPLIIVEGFIDCMRLWQHGTRRVVALMGCSLSAAQEDLLRKHTNAQSRILIMLDEDEAGKTAREDIARRLAKFAFVKIHVFEKPGTQPEHLTAEQVHALFGGA